MYSRQAKKRKVKDKVKNVPPAKTAALLADETSSNVDSGDDVDMFIENKHEIFSIIKMKFRSSVNDLKKNLITDPKNWAMHITSLEKDFLDFLDDSPETYPVIPSKAVTLDDVKSLIESSVSSKLDSLIKSSNSFFSNNSHNSLNSYSNIVSQGLSPHSNIPIASAFAINSSAQSTTNSPTFTSNFPFKKASQNSIFVQIHDTRTEPLSGEQIWQLTKSLIDPKSLDIKINNVFINKKGKVLFFVETLKDQTALFDKLNAIPNEVLKLLSITQKKDQKAKIIITNVDNSVSFETICNTIMDHDYIKPFLKPNDNITLIKRTIGNGLHSSIICEIPKELKEKIISIQRIWFGFFTAYIKNFVKTKQCFNCAEFGHFKNSCTNNPACILCSGSHCLFECPTKDSKKFKCINCTKASNPKNLHKANSLNCPHYSAHFNYQDVQTQ